MHMREQRDLTGIDEPIWLVDRNPNFGTFIAGISVIAIINSFLAFFDGDPNIRSMAIIMNYFLTIFFIIHFLYRLVIAKSIKAYLTTGWGWVDLMACIPMYQISWIFRGLRAGISFRHIGVNKIKRDFQNEGPEAIIFLGLLLIVIAMELGCALVLFFENQDPAANIKTGEEAMWWGVVTIATVGYGDFYPVTNGGRIVAVVLMAAGIGLFAALTGYLANRFLMPKLDRKTYMAPLDESELGKVSKEAISISRKAYEDIIERLDRIEKKDKSK